jgi:hypothetical protein
VIAEYGGRVVGAKAGMAFRLRDGSAGGSIPALQPADTMVHPDHRRQGLYSRMTELMKERYAERDPAILFNFPNPATLSGSLKHGWETVTPVPTYYRIQQVDALPGVGSLGAIRRRGAGVALAAYHRARATLADEPPASITVERDEGPQPALLATVANRGVPDGLHAQRDAAFYRWRLGNPNWSYTTYTARRRGTPVAAVVLATGVGRTRRLVECLPLGDTDRPDDAFRGLLARILADHEGAGLLAASGTALPSGVLREFGFLPDTMLPLSAVARPTVMVAHPFDSRFESGTLPNPHDPSSWAISWLEMDTA